MSQVTLTTVHDELEAEQLCGLLRVNGIACSHRRSNMAAGASEGTPAIFGPTEVLVDEADYERAREFLPTP